MHLGLLVIAWLMLLSPAFAISEEQQLSRDAKIDAFVWDGPLFLNDKSLKALRSLGRVKESRFAEPNRYFEGKTTEYRNLVFDGLEIYGFERDDSTIGPISVTVKKSRWPIAQGLRVGVPGSRVKEVLGTPDESSRGTIKYHGETEEVIFFLRSGTVSKIQFNYYAD